MGWKDWAAVWGAGLSTWLAVSRWLPDRPRLHLEPPEDAFRSTTVIDGTEVRVGGVVIRIVNPAKRMAYVRDWKRIKLRGSVRVIALHTRKSKLSEAERPGSLQLLLPPEAQTTAEAVFEQGSRWLLVLPWQQPWLMPVWVPAVLLVSGKRIVRYGEAAKRTVLPNPQPRRCSRRAKRAAGSRGPAMSCRTDSRWRSARWSTRAC